MKKILIYWKWVVGQSLIAFCEMEGLVYDNADDWNDEINFDEYEIIIPSPGISSSHPIYQTGKVVCELDFLASYIPKHFRIHAITGTDGKSTTSWILYHFLKRNFPDTAVYIGGNFGKPLAEILMEIISSGQSEGDIVLEVSSFMAYHIEKFQATNSILTNLHPDHLDWHKDLQEYFQAKLNLLGHTKELIVYPKSCLVHLPELNYFPINSIVMEDNIIQISEWVLQLDKDLFLDISDRQLYWDHNIRNIYLAASLAVKLGISVKKLSETLSEISSLPHRLQKNSEKYWRIWVDDSKATTAQSLYAALWAFEPLKVYLIAGWKDKGDPFSWLSHHLKNHCEQCVVMGETKHIFLQAAHEAFIPAFPVASMREAVRYMLDITRPGDIILLSPGCASFDMFKNYEDRAQQFTNAILDS